MLDEKQWSYERERLERVVKEVKRQLDEKEIATELYKENLVEIRKSMWDEVARSPLDSDGINFEDVSEIYQYVEKIRQEENKHILYSKMLKTLRETVNNPYFGRVDFEEDRYGTEEIYIGLTTLFDEDTKDILIYDWRSPISSIFYDFELGEAHYKSPAGIIKGNVTLKRQYEIYNGTLKGMFDSNIKIDDEVLREILSKNTDDKMKNIVTTIQREQNKIIRDDKNNLLVVGGSAGSGKTSIALHRIAYLLYRYKDSNISSKNIVVFSPNEIFNDYISDVLPGLGEDNMNQTTFYEYGKEIMGETYDIESINEQMEYILTESDNKDYSARVKGIKYKNSKEFLKLLKKYMDYIENEIIVFDDFYYRGNILISKGEIEDLFYNNYKRWPIQARLEKIRSRISYLLKPLQRERLKVIEEEMLWEVDFPHEVKPMSRLRRLKELKPLINKMDSMLSIDTYKLYIELFKDKDLLIRLSDDDLPLNSDTIRAMTIDNLNNNIIKYEDLSPLLLLKAEIEGRPRIPDIKHVVIDESQDYTPMQYEIFKRIFPNSNFTLLGDLNQSIYHYVDLKDYNQIVDTFKLKDSAMINLKKSYRSTKDIFDFSKKILLEDLDIEIVDRRGEIPKIIKESSKEDMLESIIKDIENLKEKEVKSIAIICKSAKGSQEVYNKLKDRINISLVTKDDLEFKKGVVVIPSYLAKGLEFDGVLVYDGSYNNYYKEEERKLFYTICTRPLHYLHIYYSDKLTPFIK